MKQDNRTQKRPAPVKGLFHTLFAKPKRLPATATQEHDWDSDVPSIKLSTAFMVILVLHVAVVGGVMLFRFLGKDSGSALAGYEAARKPAVNVAAPNPEAGIRLDDPALAGLTQYRVKPHETVDMIASMHGVTREALSRTNRLNAENPFRQGMVLVIPPRENSLEVASQETVAPRTEPRVASARPVESVAAAPKAEASTQPKVASARPVVEASATTAVVNVATRTAKEHVVKSGETLWAISQHYGVSVDALLKANNITDAKKVRIGAKLKLPSSN